MPYYPSAIAGGDLTGTYPNPTIGAAKVVNADLANMANATIKGRNTAGTGVPEDVTMAQLKTLWGTILIPTVRHTRTAGNISCSQILTTTWNDLQTATDLTVAAATNDVLLVHASGLWNNDGLSAWLDAATIVSAAPVNYIGATGGTADFGVSGWYGPPSVYTPFGASVQYVVAAGDISGGNVVLRLRYRVGTTITTKTLFATAATPFKWGVVNLGH